MVDRESPGATAGRVSEAAIVAVTRAAAGAAIMAAAGVSAIIGRGDDAHTDGAGADDGEGAMPSRIATAVLAGVVEGERRAAGLLHAARARVQPVVDGARSNTLLKPIEGLRSSGGDLADRGRADAERGAEQVLDTLDALLAYLVRDALRHVDVNELLASLDVNSILARVDLQELIERIDPNQLLERLDLDALVERIDIAALARRVLDEVDVGDLIRESTGSLTVETVDAVRMRAAGADGRLAGFVDSLLRRNGSRSTRVSISSPDARSDGR